MSQVITIYNLGGLPTAPLDNFNELQEDFKIHDQDKVMKLALVIMTRGFKYAWKDEKGKLWIIDAHQRKKALLNLRSRGVDIPEIPYEPIYAKDKKEAVEEIAAYNSEFAKKNPDTILFDKYNISEVDLSQFNLSYNIDIDNKTNTFLNTKLSLTDELNAIDYDKDYNTMDSEASNLAHLGDIWVLGNHRLMCGDSCSPDDVNTLMNNKRCDLIITDPPYNVDYQGKTDDELTIENDSMPQGSFDKFLFRTFKNMHTIAKPGASIYVFHSDTQGLLFRRNFELSGFKLAECCIWVKNSFVMGRQDYQWKHEPILYGWKTGEGHKWYGDRSQSTVWNFDKPQRNDRHPTMKPIQLITYPLLNSSKEGDIVVDLFSGSGSTLLACEQHNRTCYAMELMPNYVDATINRYIHAVGDDNVFCLRKGNRLSYKDIQHDNR